LRSGRRPINDAALQIPLISFHGPGVAHLKGTPAALESSIHKAALPDTLK
jgi:hypothetical protein